MYLLTDKLSYDVKQIMDKAHDEARYLVKVKGLSYAAAFKIGLTFAWKCAKLQRDRYSIVAGQKMITVEFGQIGT